MAGITPADGSRAADRAAPGVGGDEAGDAGPTRVLVSWDDSGTYDYKTPPGKPGLRPARRLSDRGVGELDQRRSTATGRSPCPTVTATRSARGPTRSISPASRGSRWSSPRRRRTRRRQRQHRRDRRPRHLRHRTGLPRGHLVLHGRQHHRVRLRPRRRPQPSFAAGDQHRDGAGLLSGDDQRRHRQRADHRRARPSGRRRWRSTPTTASSRSPTAPTTRGDSRHATAFKNNLQMMIDKLKAAGREPVLSHMPYSPDGIHNTWTCSTPRSTS